LSTLIDTIAAWDCGLEYDDIPDRVIEKARLQVLNIIAAALSGRHCDALGHVGTMDLPDGTATVLSAGRKTNAENAAFVNALYSMSFDFDDYLFMGHTGHSSVLVPLAIAEETGCTLRELLLAQVVANEVEGRLGASVLLGHHNGQMWSYIHAAGAAAAASKLLGLSKEQTASAIALSLYQPNYPLAPGFMLSDSKLLTASLPILSGMMCAKLAQTGMTGNTVLLEAENGFLSRFAYLPLPHMFSGFGEWWVTDTIAFKPYPGCAYIDTAVDSILGIMDEYEQKMGRPIEPSDIKHIDVFASILTMGMNALSEMYDNNTLHPVNINFSLPKSVAIALINRSLRAEHLSSAMLSRDENVIRSLSQKVRLHHDWQYTLKTQASFYNAIGGKFILKDAGVFQLIKAFRSMRRDLPSMPLNPIGLLKAWSALPGHEKRAIKDGIGKRNDYVKMDSFTFSFGARVRVDMNDGNVYEAESIVPRGASTVDQKKVVMDKLAHALGSEQRAKALYGLLTPVTPVREFVKGVL
jgi:2-methylcitrate dehydratase PrpD